MTTIVAIYLIYLLGKKAQGTVTGIIAAIIASFSAGIIYSSRWLSNPTPMLLLSAILLWGLISITERKRWGWWVVSLVAGLSLFNFGSATEVFFFPAILIFIIWMARKPFGIKKYWPDGKNLIISIAVFVLTFLPLIIFNFKHDNILFVNFKDTFATNKSFGFPSWPFITERISLFWSVFLRQIWPVIGSLEKWVIGIMGVIFLIFLPKLFKNRLVKILLIFLLSCLVGLIFFNGNKGIVYDYYLTGYYLMFIILLSITLGFIWKYKLGKFAVILFLSLFIFKNGQNVYIYLTQNIDSKDSFVIANQKRAIDWIFKDASGKEFNVDVYVPPVIPYSYDYLIKWYGGFRYGYEPKNDNISLLYTIYELDPPHPERLQAWLDRQSGIGRIIKQESFGGITAERRTRL
jgi:4-amino-4-deoxy-L-arabinose transferase-like glycosyltransferase